MSLVHVVLVILYVVAITLLRPWVRRRLPAPTSRFVPSYRRPWIAFLWLWDPLLWFLPGLVWAGVFKEFPSGLALGLSLLIPLSFLLAYFWSQGLFAFSTPSAIITKILSGSLAGAVILITVVVALSGGLRENMLWARLWVFVVTCLWGPFFLTVLLTLWSRKVVPLPSGLRGASGQAVKVILGYFTSFPKPTWVVEDGQLQTRIVGSPFLGSGPGTLVTEPENVVLLKTAAEVTRVVGPGVAFVSPMVTPAQVVDLRNQIRSTTVSATTRDGIEMAIPVSSLFRVDRGLKPITLKQPWPYRNARSVFHVVFGAEVDPSGRSSHELHAANAWEDRLLTVAAHKAKQAISFYSLDQLYAPPSPSVLPNHYSLQDTLGLSPVTCPDDPLLRSTIGKFVQRAVRQVFAAEGVEILGGSIGNKIVPLQRDVTDQRVKKWKAAFESKMKDWQINLQEKRLRDLNVRQRARGLAVVEVATQTSGRLANLDPDMKRNIRAYELLYTLISVAQNPDVRKQLPDSAVPTLEKLMRQLEGKAVDGDMP
jgi:hypothetical protein